jgi:outer membrane lipoprotein-sorting protein
MKNQLVLSIVVCTGSLISIAQTVAPPVGTEPETHSCSLLVGSELQTGDTEDFALLTAYNFQAHLIRSLHMEAMMQVKAGKEYGIGDQPIGVPVVIDSAEPNLMRMSIKLPTPGAHGIEMSSDGGAFSLLLPDHGRNVLLIGPLDAAPQSENPLLNLRPQPLMDALRWQGVTSSSEKASRTGTVFGIRKLAVTLPTSPMGPSTADIEFDVSSGLVKSVATYDSVGRTVSEVRYSDWEPIKEAQGRVVCFPRHLELARPLQDYEIALHILQIELNGEIPRSYFHRGVPGGTTVIHLNQSGNTGKR